MNYVTSRNISLAFGLPFVAAGFIGFVSNPVLSPNGLFEVNLMHNLLHVQDDRHDDRRGRSRGRAALL